MKPGYNHEARTTSIRTGLPMAAVEIGDGVIDSSIQGSFTRLCLPQRPPETDSQAR